MLRRFWEEPKTRSAILVHPTVTDRQLLGLQARLVNVCVVHHSLDLDARELQAVPAVATFDRTFDGMFDGTFDRTFDGTCSPVPRGSAWRTACRHSDRTLASN